MPALSAVLLILDFQINRLFFNVSLARPQRHCSIILVLICSVGHQMLPKIWVGTFVWNIQPKERVLSWF